MRAAAVFAVVDEIADLKGIAGSFGWLYIYNQRCGSESPSSRL